MEPSPVYHAHIASGRHYFLPWVLVQRPHSIARYATLIALRALVDHLDMVFLELRPPGPLCSSFVPPLSMTSESSDIKATRLGESGGIHRAQRTTQHHRCERLEGISSTAFSISLTTIPFQERTVRSFRLVHILPSTIRCRHYRNGTRRLEY